MPRGRPSLDVIPSATPAAGPAPARTGAAAAKAASGSTQRIVDSITNAIVERRLMPGTKLAEQQIADIFGVSRTVVRQALIQLSRHHLVTLTPARGAYVAEPSVSEAREIYEVRRLLEPAMARLLCASITDAQLAVLRAHLAEEAAALRHQDVAARTRLLTDFHHVLAQMHGNQVLAQILRDLSSRSALIALMYQSAHSAEASHAEHVAIVEAFEQRDVRAAVRLSAAHLEHVERNVRLDPRGPGLSAILSPTAAPRPAN